MIQKLKRLAIQLRDSSPFAKKIITTLNYHIKRLLYLLKSANIKMEDRTVLFITFQGKTYGDSPRAIYEYMLSDEKYKDWKFIWLFTEPEKFKEVAKNPNTVIDKYTTKNLYKYLPKAKYWVNNYRFSMYFWPRKEQVYVQCWHGTPLKRLGHDLLASQNSIDSMEDINRLYDLDAMKYRYIISPSSYASEKFISAWDLKTKGMEEKVLEIGYPRNDFLSNYTSEDVYRIKEQLGIPQDKKVILYAPTWRDNQHKSGVGFTYDMRIDFDKLQQELGEEYVLVFRLHYLVANAFSFEKYKGFIYDASSYNDINHLYVISDLLITDYSSVFFDYGILKRPMLFYMYDLEEYSDSIRGLYFDINELPGAIITKEEMLAQAIKDTLSGFVYDKKYEAFTKKFNVLEDGQASARLVKRVFTS